MICRPNNQPIQTQELELMVCWMHERPLEVGGRYLVKHTTRTTRAIVDALRYRIDVNTLHRDQTATSLSLNEMGRLRLRTSTPLLVDEYRNNRLTGSLILIDETTNDTVGAGMVMAADELAADVATDTAAAAQPTVPEREEDADIPVAA
jgi:bifunctional enzyme CysN/CysC